MQTVPENLNHLEKPFHYLIINIFKNLFYQACSYKIFFKIRTSCTQVLVFVSFD